MIAAATGHPCFDSEAKSTCARVHLPVAPRCNVQCRFCDRKYDCVNESRPGVTSAVLAPEQAVDYLHRIMEKESRITTVGIAGPGDPFATPDLTLQTLRMVKRDFPDMLLCVASNGLGMSPHVDAMASLGVTHCTITINAIDVAVGSQVYAWIRPGRFSLRGEAAAETLRDAQLDALSQLKRHNIAVKVNTIVIPGVNDHHVGQVARVVASMGAVRLNCIPLLPTAGTDFADIAPPSTELMHQVRAEAGLFLPQMEHCSRCRSDAVGLLGQDRSGEFVDDLRAAAGGIAMDRSRPCVAVASWEGMLINQHLGEATQLWIFRQTDRGYEHVDTRNTPPSGGGDSRWEDMAELMSDCRCILVNGVGEKPRSVLKAHGVAVIEIEGVIEEGLNAVYQTNDFSRLLVRRKKACQAGCTGSGGGCG